MSDVEKYIATRKRKGPRFVENFEGGYELFELSTAVRIAREAAGYTHASLAKKLGTKRAIVSRVEQSTGEVRVAVLARYLETLGLKLALVPIEREEAPRAVSQ